jgi:hypothetical protein
MLYSEQDAALARAKGWYLTAKTGHCVYVCREVKQGGKTKRQAFHRLILNAPAGTDVDHINGNGMDNRRENLRLCSRSQNLANSRKHVVTASSPFKGVAASGAAWRASGCKGRVIQQLGKYETAEEAARAYDLWAVEAHGEFANLNFPGETFPPPASLPIRKWTKRDPDAPPPLTAEERKAFRAAQKAERIAREETEDFDLFEAAGLPRSYPVRSR